MNAVIFYSRTGQSESVAEYLARQLNYNLIDLNKADAACYKNLVLVFPVHCQNIPCAVKSFLRAVKAEYLTVVATYGKMCYGNVLYEIQHKYHKNIIAGAYVPTKHAYIENDDTFGDFERLLPIVEKNKRPSKTVIPKSYKNPLSNVFPRLRSRLGLKIHRNSDCNNCNRCAECCDLKAIRFGVTDNKCIRCLKCVDMCPHQALDVKIGLFMRAYLRKKKTNKIVVYT